MWSNVLSRFSPPLCQACAKRLNVTHIKSVNEIRAISSSISLANYETTRKTVVASFPRALQPYARLARVDRPIGYWLLYWPCSWSIGLAAFPGTFPNLNLLALFGVGTVVMRSAGCTINDLWDRDFDKKVFRTATRPLATGEVSPFSALVFLGSQLTVGLGILLCLNNYSILLGACSLPLVVLYPLVKRYSFWPQAVLGLTFNWGALLGYAAVNGYCDWSVCLPLYTGSIAWTLFYDTIYAFQDTKDDKKLGLKSTALLLGRDKARPWLGIFAGVMTSSLMVTGINCGQAWPYYAGVAIVSTHLAWQVMSVNLADPRDCLRKFRSNTHIGAILFLAIVAGTYIKSSRSRDKPPSQQQSKIDSKRSATNST